MKTKSGPVAPASHSGENSQRVMTCLLCGKAHPCGCNNSSALLDHQRAGDSREGFFPSTGEIRGTVPSEAWRQEVVSRVQQHRARRRRHNDRNALELDFSAHEPFSFRVEPQENPTPAPQRYAEIVVRTEPPKVIRFPRPAPVSMPAIQEITLEELDLATPVPETPRIVEALAETKQLEPPLPSPGRNEAKQMELLPSFDDIDLEPAPRRIEDDLEIIPQAAPLGQRAVAGVVDAGIVFCGSIICAITFLKLAEEMPHSRLTLAFALAACGMFWLVFQYLFLVYGGATPGMRMSQLELCTFEGQKTSRFARQCRALASTLSGLSAGLGYAWAFIDEDRLGWHDRISQTHLREALSGQQSAFSSESE